MQPSSLERNSDSNIRTPSSGAAEGRGGRREDESDEDKERKAKKEKFERNIRNRNQPL